LSFALIALAVMAIVTSSAAPAAAARPRPTPTPAQTGDFLFVIAYRWPDMSGYLVRGDNKLLYALASYSGWFWSDNYLHIISLNGFQGNVSLEALNLPPGVTSELPPSVFVPKFGSTRFTIHLRAATDAPLTTATITLRGTSGSITHTGDARFTVVEQLPPLPPS
jgi:hypothetical protein